MLEFTKTSGNEGDLEEGRALVNIKTSFVVTKDGLTMIATRFIYNKGYRLVFTLDGTIGALGKKVNDTCGMTNEMFKTFSEIQFADEPLGLASMGESSVV